MTRPSIPYPDLEEEINARLQPVPERDRWFWARVAGYAAAAVLSKGGGIIGFVLLSPVIVGIWVFGKMRRAWR